MRFQSFLLSFFFRDVNSLLLLLCERRYILASATFDPLCEFVNPLLKKEFSVGSCLSSFNPLINIARNRLHSTRGCQSTSRVIKTC